MKVKIHPSICQEALGVQQSYSSTLSLSSGKMGLVVNATPGRITLGKGPVNFAEQAGWGPSSVWTGALNLATIVIRSTDLQACGESLYRLSYLRPGLVMEEHLNYIDQYVKGKETRRFVFM